MEIVFALRIERASCADSRSPLGLLLPSGLLSSVHCRAQHSQ